MIPTGRNALEGAEDASEETIPSDDINPNATRHGHRVDVLVRRGLKLVA
jgi:hypothetical protein